MLDAIPLADTPLAVAASDLLFVACLRHDLELTQTASASCSAVDVAFAEALLESNPARKRHAPGSSGILGSEWT